jgi:hypothetical protein
MTAHRLPRSASLIAGVALALAGAVPAGAGPQITRYAVEATFEDVTFGIETAIIDRGFVVDHVSHVGDMLNRTAGDVGAERTLYTQADVYLFCSATLSRAMMEADVDNIGHCPYAVFAYEAADAPGTVHVGYRRYPDGAMQEVQSLLDAIAREAAGLD